MADENIYKSFMSETSMETTNREFYCEKSGIPNLKAFEVFTESIDFDDKYYLTCVNIDLRAINKAEGYASGSRVMRKFFLALEELGVYVFRIQGEKFNILCKEDKKEELKKFLDEDNSDKYKVYYGMPEEPYSLFTCDDLVEEGKRLMYADKKKKGGLGDENTTDFLVGNKGNTPADLQETEFHKYISTMWFTKAKITVLEPFKEVMLYIYVTDFKPPYQSLPLLVVVDDLLEYRVFTATNVELTIEEIGFRVNARFDKQGRLQTAIFPDGKGAKNCKIEFTEKHEGVSIPSNFGKRVGKNEIYPIKQNINGVCDYVLLTKDGAELNDTGLVDINGEKYGVYMDNESIDLAKVN